MKNVIGGCKFRDDDEGYQGGKDVAMTDRQLLPTGNKGPCFHVVESHRKRWRPHRKIKSK
jgi:hypothetical protein